MIGDSEMLVTATSDEIARTRCKRHKALIGPASEKELDGDDDDDDAEEDLVSSLPLLTFRMI